MSALPVERLAWLAGVIDARGHIETNIRHGYSQPRIRITTRQVELLNALAHMCGNKVVKDDRGYVRRPCSAHCEHAHSQAVRQSSQWTVDSARATVVLFNVAPYILAQRDAVTAALEAGMQRYPPVRGDLSKQMAELGWLLPSTERAAA